MILFVQINKLVKDVITLCYMNVILDFLCFYFYAVVLNVFFKNVFIFILLYLIFVHACMR